MLAVSTTTLTVFDNSTTVNEFGDTIAANRMVTNKLRAYISSGSNKSFRVKNFAEFDSADDRIGTTRTVRIYTPLVPVLQLGYVLQDNKTQRRYRVSHIYDHQNFVVQFPQIVKGESLIEPITFIDPNAGQWDGASVAQP